MVISEVETINQNYFDEVTKSVNALVDLKVAVHRHDAVLDDKIDMLKVRLGVFSSENQLL